VISRNSRRSVWRHDRERSRPFAHQYGTRLRYLAPFLKGGCAVPSVSGLASCPGNLTKCNSESSCSGHPGDIGWNDLLFCDEMVPSTFHWCRLELAKGDMKTKR
jgi:hypothetical protein